jgi:TRAP-type uncharacterized transport system fused permease subunit
VYDQLKRFEQIIFDALSVLLVLFYSYAAVVQPAATQYHRGIYVIITYVLVFLLYKSKSRVMRVVDYILILLSIICIGYWIINFEAINYRTGAENAMDKSIAVVGVLIGIELARRVVGNAFVIIGTVMLLYGVYGPYAPDLFRSSGGYLPESMHHHLLYERWRFRYHGQRAGNLCDPVCALRCLPGKERRPEILH